MIERLVPQLRFRNEHGNDFPEWEKQELGNLATDVSYGMNAAGKAFDGVNQYIRITDIDETTNNYDKSGIVSPTGELDDKFLLKEGDIVLARTGASTGKSYYYNKNDGKVYYAGFLIRFKIDKSVNCRYIFYNTLTYRYDKWVSVMSIRSGQPGINAKEYSSYPIYVPNVAEQNKIASFFSTLDTRIELQEKKVENLEREKKGIMQGIFKQEIKFRDDEGKEYREWEEKQLGKICDIGTGKLNANAMVKGGKYPFFTCSREVYFIDEYAFDTEALLVSGNGDIGHIKYVNGKFNAYQRTYVLDNFKENISYIKEYFEIFIKRTLLKETQMGSMPYIRISTLAQFKIKIPSLPEQQEIANFLSSLDSKIEKEKEKLELIREKKKGLMQKMFI